MVKASSPADVNPLGWLEKMARLRWQRAVTLAAALVSVATGFVARAPRAPRQRVARFADLP